MEKRPLPPPGGRGRYLITAPPSREEGARVWNPKLLVGRKSASVGLRPPITGSVSGISTADLEGAWLTPRTRPLDLDPGNRADKQITPQLIVRAPIAAFEFKGCGRGQRRCSGWHVGQRRGAVGWRWWAVGNSSKGRGGSEGVVLTLREVGMWCFRDKTEDHCWSFCNLGQWSWVKNYITFI